MILSLQRECFQYKGINFIYVDPFENMCSLWNKRKYCIRVRWLDYLIKTNVDLIRHVIALQ